MPKTLLLVGTRKGCFLLESDKVRRDWTLRGPLCEAWPVYHAVFDRSGGENAEEGGRFPPSLLPAPRWRTRSPCVARLGRQGLPLGAVDDASGRGDDATRPAKGAAQSP